MDVVPTVSHEFAAQEAWKPSQENYQREEPGFANKNVERE